MVWSYKRMLSLQRFWLMSLWLFILLLYVLLSVAKHVSEGLDLMLGADSADGSQASDQP